MPIEDVQYLLRNSAKDSVLLFIDSTLRDRQKHPTPSEYAIDLDESIAHVYGIDVLDASIPSTMYNVDTNNNKLRCIGVTVSKSEGSLSTIGLSTPDEIDAAHLASLSSSMNALGTASPLRNWWLPDPLSSSYHVVVGAWTTGNAPILDAMTPLTSTVDSSAATAATAGKRYRVLRERRFESLPMWRLTNGSTNNTVTVPSDVSAVTLVSNGQTYVMDADASGADAALAAINALRSRDSAMQTYAILPTGDIISGGGGSEEFDLVIYDLYAFDGAAAWESASTELSIINGRLLTFSVETAEMEVGTYTSLNDLQGSIQDGFDATSMTVNVTSTTGRATNNDNRGKFRYATGSDLRLIIATAFCSARTTLGLDLDTDFSANLVPRASRESSALILGGQVAPMYCSVLQSDGTQHIDTPGIVSLAGARYITLRCPQIEQHMSATSRYGRYSAGIGVFKLLNTNEIAQLRFDYVSLVRKPFHPIARLSRLQFRFELPDGTLYDFKGVNHQIMMTVKYYVPTATTPADLPQSTLNPNYNPNFVDYLAQRVDPFGPVKQRLTGYDPYNEDDTDGGSSDSSSSSSRSSSSSGRRSGSRRRSSSGSSGSSSSSSEV